MFKVYKVHQQISINNDDFINTFLIGNYLYIDEAMAERLEKPIVVETFSEAVKMLNTGNVSLSYTIKFLKWTFLHLSLNGLHSTIVSKRKFKSLAVRWHCEEVELTMKELYERLSAKEFCQYLTDNGLNSCQITNS